MPLAISCGASRSQRLRFASFANRSEALIYG
jgi:hypothetical protein